MQKSRKNDLSKLDRAMLLEITKDLKTRMKIGSSEPQRLTLTQRREKAKGPEKDNINPVVHHSQGLNLLRLYSLVPIKIDLPNPASSGGTIETT